MKKNKGFTLIELLIVIAIIGILAAVAIPQMLKARTKAKCSGSQKNWSVISGESANELDTMERGNKIGTGPWTATHAIGNVIWRHCESAGATCSEFVPGHCDGIQNDEKAPFTPTLPSLVETTCPSGMTANTGQVGMQEDTANTDVMIICRDLVFEPVCGESEPIQSSITTKD